MHFKDWHEDVEIPQSLLDVGLVDVTYRHDEWPSLWLGDEDMTAGYRVWCIYEADNDKPSMSFGVNLVVDSNGGPDIVTTSDVQKVLEFITLVKENCPWLQLLI